MRITLLFEPSPDRAIPFAVGPERYQRLADELSRYAGTRVQIIKDVLRNAPADTYVLLAGGGNVSRSLADCGPALAARLAPRIMLLDVSWQKVLEQLEQHRLAGAVDSLRFSEWLARPSSCAGPYGLRYLTNSLGASCVPLPSLRSGRYCLLQSKHHHGMPHLLANYLAAYDRDRQALSAVPFVSLARALRAPAEGAKGRTQPPVGRQEKTASISHVELVSIKRAVDSLKRARESAPMTLLQVAESSGVDPEELRLLEGSDYARATLGTLRAYFLALEPAWGWTLAEAGELAFPPRQNPQDWAGARRANNPPLIASGVGGSVEAADFSVSSPSSTAVPRVLVERGMTVLRDRRPRRRQPERETEKPTTRTRREESYAAV